MNINKDDLKQLEMDLNKSNENREQINNISQDIISLSKKAILKINNNDFDKAEEIISEMESKLADLLEKEPSRNKTAIQEYIETIGYFEILKNNNLIQYAQLKDKFGIEHDSFLKGIFDLTGELVRHALNCAINNKPEETQKIFGFVNELYNELSTFNFKSGELRKGFDSVRWNLKKLQDVVFELKVKGKLK